MAGKFAHESDEYTYGLSLEGSEEETGDVQFRGHACLVLFSDEEIRHVCGMRHDPWSAWEVNHENPTGENPHTRGCDLVGAIVEEDGQGFVTVTYYVSAEDAREDFERLRIDLEPAESDENA